MNSTEQNAQSIEQYPEKTLSELLELEDRQAFACRVTGLVDDHYLQAKPYREKCEKNINYWRNKHWKSKPNVNLNEPNPNVPAIHSMTENCIADSMDNFPDQVLRGVNGDDDVIATILTESTRFAMQRSDYEGAYEQTVASAHKVGAGVMQRFWNRELAGGLGEVDYKFYSIKDVVWDMSAKKVNDGRFFATFDWISEDQFQQLYPGIDCAEASPDTEPDKRDDGGESEMSQEEVRTQPRNGLRIINFYWMSFEPRNVGDENTGSHITYINSARVFGNHVLEAHPKQYEYDSYMVSMVPYIPIDDEPVGLSLIDIFQDEADTINLIEKAFCKNMQASSVLRYAVNNTANVNEDELTDLSKILIHADATHEGAMREFKVDQFGSQALNYMQAVLGRMKEYSGQLDVNIGQSSAGVTAASAIMALQEYGSKRPRSFVRACYRLLHKPAVRDTIFLQKHHYTTERIIRISRKARDLIEKQMKEAEQPSEVSTLPKGAQNGFPIRFEGNTAYVDFGKIDLTNFDEDYDIEIVPQKKTAATSNLINSVVQQLANSGLFQGKEDLLIDLLEVPGIGEKAQKIRDRVDIDNKFQQLTGQMQQLVQQMNGAVKQNQQLQQQTAELEKALLQEKLNVLRAQVSGAMKGEDTEAGAQTAEQAIAQFEQSMGLSQQA